MDHLDSHTNAREEEDQEYRAPWVEHLAGERTEITRRVQARLLSRFSHELRTPLNAILGFGQLLEMDADLTASQRESVDFILLAGRRLLALVDTILELSTVAKSGSPPIVEPVLVSDLLEESLRLVEHLAASRNIDLRFNMNALCAGHVLAQRAYLMEILQQLLSNAIKYNHAGGQLYLECECSTPGWLRIRVRDTGPGISLLEQELLFVPLERLGAERKGVAGAGLGLVVAKLLTEAMGGRIGLESAIEEGSTFWVELPTSQSTLELK